MCPLFFIIFIYNVILFYLFCNFYFSSFFCNIFFIRLLVLEKKRKSKAIKFVINTELHNDTNTKNHIPTSIYTYNHTYTHIFIQVMCS